MELIKPKRFKPRPAKIKGGNNYRINTSICPNCLSKLKVNQLGNWECSGDKLKLWIKDFQSYENLDAIGKQMYKDTLSNKDWFVTTQAKWKAGDLSCDYNNKVIIPKLVHTQEIPDPMFVGRVERSLGRELTEAEKYGEAELFKKGERYTDTYEEGATIVEIPTINFPEDF